MRSICYGCGKLRKIQVVANPEGFFVKFVEGKVVTPERKYCSDCGRIAVRRVLEWGLRE